MNQALTPEAIAVIAKVEKLLALAGNNDNEHQAQAATAKAMELLAAYNLDMAVIGTSGKGAQRSDTRLKGGLYQWQRDLWKAVSELNFCLYRSIRGLAKGSVYEHRVIGSHVNVVSTKVMADYLQQTVERLAQQWAKQNGYNSPFVKPAIAYREGMAERLTERLHALRAERLHKDDEAIKARAKAGDTEPGTHHNALVLLDVVQTETDLNNDMLNGYEPGTTAKWRSEWKARQLRATQEADRALQERDAAEAADPALKEARLAAEKAEEEYREKLAEAARKREERNAKRRKGDGFRWRQETAQEARRRMGSFSTGYADGNNVGLDQQVGNRKDGRIG